MMSTAENLAACLEEELQFNRGLYDLGIRKRDELIHQQVEAVEKTNLEEQTLVVALGEAASRRVKFSQELSQELGVPEEQATIRGIAARLQDPGRSRMHKLALDLRDAMARVRRLNESNRLLTQQSLRYIQDFFEILTGSGSGGNTYGRTGQRPSRPGRLMIDHVI